MPSIARSCTLWTKQEISNLFKTAGRSHRYSGLDIRLAPASSNIGIGRLLIITPRKSGTAPQRARIRRRIKAIFYEHKIYERGCDWIIFIKKEAMTLSFSQLRTIILSLCLPGT